MAPVKRRVRNPEFAGPRIAVATSSRQPSRGKIGEAGLRGLQVSERQGDCVLWLCNVEDLGRIARYVRTVDAVGQSPLPERFVRKTADGSRLAVSLAERGILPVSP